MDLVFQNSGSIAFETAGERVSFAQLHTCASRLARKFDNGSFQLLIFEAASSPDFIACVLGAWRAGNAVAVVPQGEATSLRDARGFEGAAYVTHSGDLVWRNEGRYASELTAASLVLRTSGSTGEARYVVLGEKALAANFDTVRATLRFGDAERQHVFLPLHYAFGLLGQVLPALQQGLTTHLHQGLGALSQVDRKAAGGMLSCVPSQMPYLERLFMARGVDPAAWTHLVTAGSALSSHAAQRAKDYFRKATIYKNYGLTEAGPRVLSISSEDERFWTDSAGLPVGAWQLRTGANGALEIFGPQLMLGYLANEQANAEIWTEDGWLRTGDLVDIALDGSVRLKGRIDELVKIAGERVSLSHIEQAIEATGMVAEVAVLAVEARNTDERVLRCFVVPSEGHFDSAKMRDRMAAVLPPQLVPKSIVVVDRLPRTSSGKLMRRRLADAYT